MVGNAVVRALSVVLHAWSARCLRPPYVGWRGTQRTTGTLSGLQSVWSSSGKLVVGRSGPVHGWKTESVRHAGPDRLETRAGAQAPGAVGIRSAMESLSVLMSLKSHVER